MENHLLRHSDSTIKISKAVLAVQSQVKSIARNKMNTFHKYTYADLQAFVDGTKELLVEQKLVLIESVLSASELTGGRMLAQIEVMLLHDSGEWFKITCFGEGADVSKDGKIGDKGLYKAITGGRKYAIAALFNIATTDDPEKSLERKNRKKADMEAAQTLECEEGIFIESVTVVQSGEKNGRKYNRYAVEMTNGNTYYTFSDDLAKQCKQLAEDAVAVAFDSALNQKGYGMDLLMITEMPSKGDRGSIVSDEL